MSSQSLRVLSCLEKQHLPSKSAPTVWGAISLNECALSRPKSLPVDFIIGLDISASMKVGDRYDMVKKAILRILDTLVESGGDHTITLVAYNHKIECSYHFLRCDAAGRDVIMTRLESIVPYGSTDIVNALKSIVTLATQRTRGSFASVLLFSDEDASSSLLTVHPKRMEFIRGLSVPLRTSFHFFGIGDEVDSLILRGAASHFGGVYHFVYDQPSMVSSVEECISSVIDTRLRDLTVTIECKDGCRLIKCATPFPRTEIAVAKKYVVSLGSMSGSESKSILLQFSLRKLDTPHATHPLATIRVSYLLSTGVKEEVTNNLSVTRLADIPPNNSFVLPPVLAGCLNRLKLVSHLNSAAASLFSPESDASLEKGMLDVSDPDMLSELRSCLAIDNLSQRSRVCASLASSHEMERMVSLKRRLFTLRDAYVNYIGENDDDTDAQ